MLLGDLSFERSFSLSKKDAIYPWCVCATS